MTARIGLTVAAAGVVASLLVAPTHATFAGANGRIAFGSDLEPGPVAGSGAPGSLELDVHTIAPDGTGRMRLTDSPGQDAIVAWSPDGSKIAFSSFRDGNGEIYVMNADGSGAVRLTRDPAGDTQPRWSPDGMRLVFVSLRTGNLELFVMDADGSDVSQVTNHPAGDLWPEFSPDGSRIAFASTRSGSSAIYTMAPDGSDVEKVTADSLEASQPDWSPDGTKLVFANNECSACPPGRPLSDLFVLTLATGEIRQITHMFGNNLNPTWSPDGTRIAFWHAPAAPRTNNTDIFTVAIDGTGLTNVTRTPTLREFVPDWGAATAS